MKKLIGLLLSALILSSAAIPASAAPIKSMRITVENTKKGVKLSWKKIKGAKKYKISRKLTSSGKYKKLKVVKKLSFTDKKAKQTKKYSYYVEALNSKGSAKAASSAKSIIRLKAPTGIKVKVVKHPDEDEEYSAIYPTLSWNKVKGAKKYEIYRQEITAKKTGKFKFCATTKKTKYEDYAESGSYYRYKVRAVNGKSKGAFSSLSKKYGYIDSTFVTANRSDTFDGVKLSWNECRGAQGYKIFKSTDNGKGKTFKQIKLSYKYDKKEYSYVAEDKDVKVGEAYCYYVLAYNKFFTSKKDDTNIATVIFRDYDFAVQIGEEKTEPMLSRILTQYGLISELSRIKLDFNLKSNNEKVAKVDVRDNGDKTYSVLVKGVSEGYADIALGSESSLFLPTDSSVFRIKVSAEPVYDFKLKKGETYEVYGGILGGTTAEGYKVMAVSSDEKILKINNPTSPLFTFTGVSEGEATISVTVTNDLGIATMDVITLDFKVLVE